MFDGIKSLLHIGPTKPVTPPPPPPLPVAEPPAPAAPPAMPPGQFSGPLSPGTDPNPDAGAARAKADGIWLASATPHDAGTKDSRTIDKAGGLPDVHDGLKDAQAVQQLFANRELEQKAYAKLSPEDRARYDHVEATVDNDPQAHLALQVMLLENKLAAGPKSRVGDQTVLQGLDKMATQPGMQNISKNRILGETLREIAQPNCINQAGKETCSVTVLQQMTARDNPAEYVRIMGGLSAANPEDVKLAGNNATIKRLPANESDDRSGRTMTSQLWQSSFMQLAAGLTHGTYDVAKDVTINPNGSKEAGMTAQKMLVVAQDLTGKDWNGNSSFIFQTHMFAEINQAITKVPPQPITVTLATGKFDAHGTKAGEDASVQVLSAKNGQVKYKDAKGTHTIPEGEFMNRLRATPNNNLDTFNDAVMSQLKTHVASQPPGQTGVPVQLHWGNFDEKGATHWGPAVDGSHFVNVTKIENGQVYFLNPHGHEEHMPEADFKNRLQSAFWNENKPIPAAH
ncbi:MAG: hypothetical protein JWM80_2882 [Cyanobacteria bacterium RYN_339]|nr:hypothetical protein [Cyanobacteria bacterium RYN_339]